MDARHDPRHDVVGGERFGDGDHAGKHRHSRADRPGHLYASDFGCENWLFWDQSVDDVDPRYAILYEVRVNGVFDGDALAIDRWITYGTQTSNTFSVQAVDSAGNRSSTSSITLDNQTC